MCVCVQGGGASTLDIVLGAVVGSLGALLPKAACTFTRMFGRVQAQSRHLCAGDGASTLDAVPGVIVGRLGAAEGLHGNVHAMCTHARAVPAILSLRPGLVQGEAQARWTSCWAWSWACWARCCWLRASSSASCWPGDDADGYAWPGNALHRQLQM